MLLPSDIEQIPEIDFVETSVSERIVDTIDLAVKMGDNVAIFGAPGIGKSSALRWMYDGTGHSPSRVFTLDNSIGKNATHVLQQLCESYGISAGHSRA